MKKAGASGEETSNWLIARHVEERRREILKLYKPEERAALEENPAFGAGMSQEDANKILSEWADNEAMQEIGRVWDRMNRRKLKAMVEYGLITEEQAAVLRKKYKHWAPLKTLSEDEHAFMGMGRGLDIRNPEFKRAFGRSSMADNVLVPGFTSAAMAIYRGEKGRVGQAMYREVKANPDPDFATIEIPKTRKVIDKKTGFVKEIYDRSALNDPEVFGTKVDGKPVYIRFNKEYQSIVDALTGANTIYGGKIVNAIRQGSILMKRLITRDNPFFPPINLIKDVGGGSIVALGEHGIVIKPWELIPAWGVLMDTAYGREPTGKFAEYAKEYREVGAPIATMGLSDLEKQAKKLSKMARGRNPIAEKAQAFGELVNNLNDVVENGTRFLIYVNMRKRGYSPKRAGLYSKESTTNFERVGEVGPILNANFLFLTAGLGGIRRGSQALKHPGVQGLMLAGAGLGVLMDMLNRSIAGVDPEDEENYYDKVEDHVKNANLVIFYGDKEGDYITIPSPWFFRWFYNLGTNIGAVTQGARSAESATGAVLVAAMEELNPLGGAAHPAQLASPWYLKPGMDIWINEDWAGRPIFPTRYDRSLPDSELHFKSVSPWAKSATRFLNRALGGTEAEPAEFAGVDLSISPETLDHFAKFLTPGVLSELRRVMERPLAGKMPERWQIPVLRRFWRGQNPYYSERVFWDNAERIGTVKRRVAARESAGYDPPEDAALNKNYWRAKARRIKSQYTELADKRREAKTDAERDKYQEQIETLLKRFNRDIERAVDRGRSEE
jgi:hypothetical protein